MNIKTTTEKIEDVLEESDCTVEGANYHDRYGLARKIFKAIRRFCPEENHLKIASKIADIVSGV